MAREDINNITIVGNLTKDPEATPYKSGDREGTAGKLRIACNRRPPRGGGEGKADFIDVKVFDGLADTCKQHLSKGRRVGVTGRLQIDEVPRKEGEGNMYFTYVLAQNVQFLDAPSGNGGGGAPAEPASDLPF